MKFFPKFLIAGFLVIGLSFISVPPVMAGPGCAAGCDCTSAGGGILGQMQRHADAMRVRNRAYAREIYEQNDNVLGMTCFDRALTSASRLGQMFSDKNFGMPTAGADISPFIFGMTPSYPSFGLEQGAGRSLTTAMDSVLSSTMQSHGANFTDSLSAALGTTAFGFLGGAAGQIEGFLDDALNGPMQDVTNTINTINNTQTQIQSILDTINSLPLPIAVAGVVSGINALWNTISGYLGDAMNLIQSGVMGILGPILGLISSVNFLDDPTMPDGCDRVRDLWTGAPGFSESIIGSGVKTGTPYFSIEELLGATVPGGGIDLLDALSQNQGDVLQGALDDLTGVLSGPGNMPTWPAVPYIPNNASVQDVINQM